MRRYLKILLPFLILFAVVSSIPAGAAPSEKRLALVIGNASYKSNRLATTVNDAALVAETLRAAGFDVMGARDLDEDLLRQAFRDFIDAVAKAGPDAVAAVYFAGYGLQLEGENYLLPVDANIAEASDVPRLAVRLSDQTRALARLHLKASFMILDAARKSSLPLSGQVPASGLAWLEPEPNMLIAFNASPGTVSPDDGDGYGCYAKALAEMILEGGLTPANVFDRVRLRVNELTKGAQVPWDASGIETKFMFFERGPGAPERADSPERTAGMRAESMRSLGANNAYLVALLRDTFDGYTDFLAEYWRGPMTKQVRALLAVRREAITWRRTYEANEAAAYWSYLERFPRGPHVGDARRLLAHLGAVVDPPDRFARMEFDVPPPLPDELRYIERPAIAFDDPAFGLEPPQQPPVYFLEPSPDFLNLSVPPAPSEAYVLPPEKFVSLPVYVGLPADVVPPPGSRISDDVRKMRVISSTNDGPTKPDGQAISSISPSDANKFEDRPRLPPSVATRATQIKSQTPPPPASNPVEQEEVRLPPPPSVPPVSSTPIWATLDPAARGEMNSALGAPVPTLSPTPPWATDYGIRSGPDLGLPPLTTHTEPPLPVDTIPAPPPTTLSLRNRHATTASPRTTGSIPLPISRPPTFVPQQNRNRPKPIARAVSTSSPVVVDQAGQNSLARPNRPAPSTHLARPPKAPLEVSLPKPQKKPCLAANGKPTCN